MQETLAVALSGLVKRFGTKVAVNNVHLEIPQGTCYGLVGPNGAGKTTTLSMLTGMLRPDMGNAYVFGQDVWSDTAAAKRQLGIMPEADQLFNRLTGLQLLVYSGMLRGMKRDVATSRAHDLLQAFDLQGDASKLVVDYSAGMTKKIALATAMIHAPKILVLDEPFESVDPVSSANIRDILQTYVHAGGTVIVSSHVMGLVEKICTHVAVIAHGQVLASGTVAQVADGMDLEERFFSLVGGRHESQGFAWLGGVGEQPVRNEAAQDEAGFESTQNVPAQNPVQQ